MTTNEAPPPQESNYFTPQGEFRVDSAGSQTLLNCLMYKLAYYRFGEVQMYNGPAGDSAHFFTSVIVYQYYLLLGYDRTRNVEIGNKNIKLRYLEEAYTSEHWLVRIYRSVLSVWWPHPL
jgi:dolichyl-diphosphooligosaccharide--protein glycosyltransferase